MKRIVLFTLLAALMSAPSALSGDKQFGKKLTLKETTKVSDILANPEQFNGKRVLVEGVITEVCSKRGCWIQIGSDKEFQSIQFKVEDGVIVFPMEVKGKTAKAEGVVDVRTVSVEDQIKQGKHHEEETGEKFDSTTVKGPKVSVRITGEGALVR